MEITGQKQGKPEFSRRRLWMIALPVLLAFIIIMAFVVGVVVPRSSPQISILADLILICFTLLPVVICLSPLYLILMAGAFGMNSVIDKTEKLLVRGKTASQTARNRTITAADQLNRRSIGIGTRLAFLDRIFEEKTTPDERESDHEKHS